VETPRIKARPPRRRKEEGESLIDEIASTKAEIVPENDKQKEQIDMIDQFIKSQPSFANAKEKPNQPVSDLTAIKTGEFADSIVSETLVEILIKQGKKDKAVEVLKKLIWKFPQKKAYFAAQIEELKK
jgi:predicted Zn-dependent protease